MPGLWSKLKAVEQRYREVTDELADPEVIGDRSRYQTLARTHAELSPIVEGSERYTQVSKEMDEAKEMLKDDLDSDFRSLVEEEQEALEKEKEQLEQHLKTLLLPKDPLDEKNVIVEIRAGTGGEEAALYAADLFRMYNRYAERQGWRSEPLSQNATELGGFKEIVFMIHGRGAFSRLKYESGVHRVQRIPSTEAGGRVHTSTATVAVLPEAEEVEAHIDSKELRIDVYRSSGPGGQSVNTTDSAVRITHLPSGLVVSCQDEKSQHKNRDKAMRILRARLLDLMRSERDQALAKERKGQVGSGDRSERIRTYNFPQNRVTDHRIGLTLHRLGDVLEGDLGELVGALMEREQVEMLEGSEAP